MGLQLTAGELAVVTAPETATDRLRAGELARLMLPLGELPLVAELRIRTETVPPAEGRFNEVE